MTAYCFDLGFDLEYVSNFSLKTYWLKTRCNKNRTSGSTIAPRLTAAQTMPKCGADNGLAVRQKIF